LVVIAIGVVLLTCCVVSTIFAVIPFLLNRNVTPSYNPVPVATASPVATETKEFIGIVHSSGLTTADKMNIGLIQGQFMLTDLTSAEGKTKYFALESEKVSLAMYEGKCVNVHAVRVGIDTPKLQHPELSVLQVSSVDLLQNQTFCVATTGLSGNEVARNNKAIISLRGTISRITRPSYDVNYDYGLSLDTPIKLPSPKGEDVDVRSLPLIFSSQANWQVLENNVGTSAEITGFIGQGFAGSDVFVVNNISPLSR